ncbi:hypothetical protein CDO73_23170 [Saccharibacillus sp. O23]|uniref:DUF1963 domain-containing protein n=1 Tax=Saccharibacillus sp. O23 TaxID=2009338 RepID=UPI000B4E18E7|nr:YwqG family protein [Saccharibacillus sp. O23]OWR27155.1 hypothetical protein CDO73_23170 [Saccharibacillus sp. O23]
MSLSEHNRSRLLQAIEQHEFGHAREYLLNSAKQTVSLEIAEPENYRTIGSSRVAGEPDLPEKAPWPSDAQGEPMTFVLQLKLDELQGLDPENRLPEKGNLFFFAGYYDSEIEHRVLYASPEEMRTAARRSAPAPTVHEKDDGPFRSYGLNARASLDLPGYGYLDEEAIENEERGWEEYEDLIFELEEEKASPIVKMFGYAEGQHGDDEYMAALKLFGCESTYDPNEAIERLTQAFGGDRERAEREVSDMVMLAEIDSDQSVGFLWGDAGVLHYFIRGEDLLQGSFERTYCSFYSS